MSTSVDSRIVQMKFDNKDFEQSVRTSMATLQNLDRNLEKLNGAAGLSNLAAAARGVTLDHLSGSVDAIQNKFTTLGIVGVTALTNIANKAVDAGERMLKSLTIDPVMDGLKEYELKMSSVQTIKNSSGEDLETVNGYLEELNQYADQTIYSFSDMTASIGKFTNAGVSLDMAVKAIQGISNEAALSGANAQQASHAMYNFAQALSSGSVKLIDWKSIENANMATVEFKQELINTAVELGTLVKEGDDYISTTTDLQGKTSDAFNATSMFNDSLSHQWMTSEVLTETLARYADAETELGQRAFEAAMEVKTFSQMMDTLKEGVGSGWATTFELIFGDYEEAKKMWTDVYSAINGILEAQADARNELLRGWKELHGRDVLIASLTNVWHALLDVMRPIREAFRDIFPAMTAQRLYDITAAFWRFTTRLKVSDVTAQNIRRTFRGIFALFDIGIQIIKAVFRAFRPLAALLPDMGGGLLGITAALGDGLYFLDQWLKKTDLFGKIADGIAVVLQFLADKLRIVLHAMRDWKGPFVEGSAVMAGFSKAAEGIGTVFKFLAKEFAAFREAASWNLFVQGLKAGFSSIGSFLSAMGPSILAFFDLLKTALAVVAENTDIVKDILGGAFVVAMILLTRQFSSITKVVPKLGEAFVGMMDDIGQSMKDRAKAEMIRNIAISIGILAVALFLLARIPSDQLLAASGAVAALFGELVGSMLLLSKFGGEKGALSQIGSMIAVLMLAGTFIKMAKALKIIGDMNWDQIKNGIIAMGAMTAYLIAMVITIALAKGPLIRGAIGMELMAMMIRSMIKTLRMMDGMDWKQTKDSLKIMAALMAEIAVFFLLSRNLDKMGMRSGIGLLLFAEAMKLMVGALVPLAVLNPEKMVTALEALAGMLLAVMLVFREMGEAKNVVKTAFALVLAAGAINMLALAIKTLSSEEIEHPFIAIGSLAAALALVAGALRLMPKEKALGLGFSLMLIGKALKAMSEAVLTMGAANPYEIRQGLLALISILYSMAAALGLVALAGWKNVMAAASAIMSVTMALILLVPVLKVLGSMGGKEIAKGVLALCVVLVSLFGILGVTAFYLGPLVPLMLALGVAVVLLSSSLLIAGMAVVLFAKGLSLIGTNGALAAAAVGAILFAIIELIPELAKAIAHGFVAFVQALRDMFVEVVDAVVDMVHAACDGILDAAPYIVETALKLLDTVLDSLNKYAPSILEKLMLFLLAVLHALDDHIVELTDVVLDILIKFINSFADHIPALVDATMKLITNFFAGITQSLKNMSTGDLEDALLGVDIMAGILIAMAGFSLIAPEAFAGVLEFGIVVLELIGVLSILGGIAQIPGLKWLIEEGGEFLMSIGTAVGKFIGGIVGGIKAGAGTLPSVGESLSKFMENIKGFIEGANTIQPGSMTGVKEMTEAILTLTGAGILDKLTSWLTGGDALIDFGKQLTAFGPYLSSFGGQVSNIEPAKVYAAAKVTKDIAETMSDMPDKVFGTDTRLVEFGKQLVDFAPSMVAFADIVKDIQPDSVRGSADAVTMLANMAKALPNDGGVWGAIAGNNSLADFGKMLPDFGENLVAYADKVKDITAESVSGSANAVDLLSKMAADLPNQGGLVSLFTGDNSLLIFGSQLPGFGENLKAYVENVRGISEEDVSSSANAGKLLAEMADAIPNDGGLWGVFVGNNSIDDFGKALSSFGKYFADYDKEIANINPENIFAGTRELRKLVAVCKEIDTLHVSSISSFGRSLRTMAETGIKHFTDTFKEAKKRTQDAISLYISNVKQHLDKKADALKEAGRKAAEVLTGEFIKGLEDYADLVAAIDTFCQAVIQRVLEDLPPETFRAAGRGVLNYISQGMQDPYAIRQVLTSIDGVMKALIEGVKGYYGSMAQAGQYVVDGLITGLRAGKMELNNASSELGTAVSDALHRRLDINSPSRVAMRIGGYVSEGLALGMRRFAKAAVLAAEDTGDQVLDGMEGSLSGVGALADWDIFQDPVIRPVLDLSEIEAGASQIGSLLNNDASYQLAGRTQEMVDARLTDSSNSRLSVDNRDVVDAVKGLRNEFAELLEKVSGLQVILDSGTLVGEMAPAMDGLLGSRMLRTRRERGY